MKFKERFAWLRWEQNYFHIKLAHKSNWDRLLSHLLLAWNKTVNLVYSVRSPKTKANYGYLVTINNIIQKPFNMALKCVFLQLDFTMIFILCVSVKGHKYRTATLEQLRTYWVLHLSIKELSTVLSIINEYSQNFN